MKNFKNLLILFLISILIISVGAVSAADDSGASENILNAEVSADLNAVDDSPVIEESNLDDVISVNEENDEKLEIQSGESDALKASGNTITVSGNTFKDIQNAIYSADEGDTIILNGTYYGSGDCIYLSTNQLSIKGNGKTVLDAKGLSEIFNVYGDGVVFENLNINGIDKYTAIYWDGSGGVISNCNFTNNHEISISSIGSDIMISNCNFANNYERSISWDGSGGVISNCNFTNNHATSIYRQGSGGVISNCNFTNNNVTSYIINILGDNNIDHCIFENNYAGYYDEYYDVEILRLIISIEGGLFNLTDSSFVNNDAYVIDINSHEGSITGCTFINNSDIFMIIDEGDFLKSIYIDNGLYDFNMEIYGDVILGNPKHYEEVYYADELEWLIYLEHYGSKEGNLVVYVNGIEAYNEEMNHVNRISASDLKSIKYGLVNLTVKFVSGKSELVLYNDSVYLNYTLSTDGDVGLYYYESTIVNIYLPEDATGKLTLNDGIKTYTLKYADGQATFKLNGSSYKIGNHTLKVSLKNDPIYPNKTITSNFYIIPQISVPSPVAIGEDEFIIFDCPDDFDGVITIYNGTVAKVEDEYDDDYYDYNDNKKDKQILKISDAKGLVKIPISKLKLKTGKNWLFINVSGEGDYEAIWDLDAFENDPRFSSSIDSNNIKFETNAIVRMTAPKITDGYFVIDVDGIEYKELLLSKTSFVEIISGVGVGEHQIKLRAYDYWVYSASGSEHGPHYIYSNTVYLNVTEEGPATLNASLDLDYSNDNLIVKLTDIDGNPLADTVSVFVNGVENSVTTNKSGIGKLKITENSTINAVYTDSNGFNVSSKLVVKVVEKTKNVYVSANATISLTPGDNRVKVVLKDLNGTALSKKNVTITVNGEKSTNKTNSKGEINVAVSGNFTIDAVYTDKNGASVSASLINVENTNTITEYLTPEIPVRPGTAIVANNITATAKISKNLTVTLKDENGIAIANKEIKYTVNGVTKSVTTNAKGVAKIPVNRVAGSYYYYLCFLGDDDYKASMKTVKATVKKQAVKATLPKKAYKAKATKKLTFTLKNSAGKAIAKKKITFKVNGKTYTANTNSKGIATVYAKVTKKGKYLITAKFVGDSIYKAITKKAYLTVK